MRRAIGTQGPWRGLVLVAVAVALVLLAATPALAAPAPTSWQVSPESKVLTYGQGVILTGTLTSGAAAVGGIWVDVYQATTETGSADFVCKLTSPTGPYATGAYSTAVMPSRTMYYQFRWAGDADYEASNSDVIPVQVKPALGKPSCPSSVKVDKKVTVKGSVKPGEPSAPVVKIKSYRKNKNGAWTGYKTYGTKISGTQYSQSITITKTGKYKFKVVSVDSAEYAAGESGYSTVLTVKK